jgi:hypothetical protein
LTGFGFSFVGSNLAAWLVRVKGKGTESGLSDFEEAGFHDQP